MRNVGRIMTLSLIMVLCLLVYRLAEWRLRQPLAQTGQTVPTQLRQPTTRPTLRCIFECFEGIDLVAIRGPGGGQRLIAGLQPLHTLVVRLLGTFCQEIYGITN
jgi:transposase